MARRSAVTYWRSRGGYGCWIKGTQYILAKGPKDEPDGPTFLAAMDAFRQRLSLSQAGTTSENHTLRVICETYIRHAKSKRKPSTIAKRVQMLRGFLDIHGELPVGRLTKIAVSEYIETKRERKYNPAARKVCGWGPATARLFIDSLSAALNWAKKQDMIPRNPISGIERPPTRKRSAEVVLTAEDHQRILAASHPAGRDFVIVLGATGARPGEIANATAADFDPAIGAIVYKSDDRRREDEFAHKTSYTGRDRVIYLHGEALDVIRRLIEKYPSGPLFRSLRGGKPGKQGLTRQAIMDRFAELRRKLGIKGLTAYSYRHSFATRWLESGRSVEILAYLMGDAPATVIKYYSHVAAQHATLRNHLAGFIDRDSAAGKTQTAPQTRNGGAGA